MSKSTSPQDQVNTTAHLLETTAHHLAHTHRHAVQLMKSKTLPEQQFNHEHLMTHLNGGIEHVQKLMEHMRDNYPPVASELDKLEQTVPRSTVKSALLRAGNLMAKNK